MTDGAVRVARTGGLRRRAERSARAFPVLDPCKHLVTLVPEGSAPAHGAPPGTGHRPSDRRYTLAAEKQKSLPDQLAKRWSPTVNADQEPEPPLTGWCHTCLPVSAWKP